ncbi:hypothetical protein SOASR031_03950 [Leminorella grimontii]|nr:hypothetical protein SOASR031_03950 [Leminorella grimontii]
MDHIQRETPCPGLRLNSSLQVWKEMHTLLPFSPDPVVTHGDVSLDNLIFDKGILMGCIDVGRVGLADRYQDLAIHPLELSRGIFTFITETAFSKIWH